MKQLMEAAEVRWQLGADVKAKSLPEGKAPRFLIANGDNGQLMARLVISCFEHLLFSWFEHKSIKHTSKCDAMVRILETLKKRSVHLLETDGSAWDTTCSAAMRGLIENPARHARADRVWRKIGDRLRSGG